MTTPLIKIDLDSTVSGRARGDVALANQRPAMDALDAKDLRQINVDIALAVSRALGVGPAIAANRATIARDLPAVNLAEIDQLEERALALSAVNSDYQTAAAPPPGLQAYVTETFESRNVLLSIVKMLIACNYIKEDRIASLNGGHGYRECADDALALVAILNNNWAVVEGKVPVTRDLLDHVQGVAEKQLELLGIKEQQPLHVSELSDLRTRAFTLLDRSYEEFRRAMLFLRYFEGDADTIVPPLRMRGPRSKDQDKPAARPAEPGSSESTTGTPAPVTPAPANPSPAPSGLPRNSPFTA